MQVVESESARKKYVVLRNQNVLGGYVFDEIGYANVDIIVDFKSIRLRPTHYSLRALAGGEGGMRTTWALDGSIDGVTWHPLDQRDGAKEPRVNRENHRWSSSQLERNLRHDDDESGWSDYESDNEFDDPLQRAFHEMPSSSGHSIEDISEFATNFMESECRSTWDLHPIPSEYYRY